MKYTVRPTGSLELIERGMAKIYREDNEGRREEVGDYTQSLLPKGARTHRVFFDTKQRKYAIDLDQKELNEIVYEMRLVDPETKRVIEKADPRNEHDPFFKHESLYLDVPNSGLTLDTETAHGRYWMAAIKSEPMMFNIDNTTDNPLVKKVQSFKVTTAGHSDVELRKEITEGEKATGIYHAIKDDLKRMVEVARGMDIIVSDNPDIEMIRQQLFIKITSDKDFKTRDGVRNIERFLELNDMKEGDRNLRAAITEALGLKLITRDGRKYVYEDVVIGTSADKAFHFLKRKENEDMRALLLAQIKASKNG